MHGDDLIVTTTSPYEQAAFGSKTDWRVRAISAANLHLRVNHIYVNSGGCRSLGGGRSGVPGQCVGQQASEATPTSSVAEMATLLAQHCQPCPQLSDPLSPLLQTTSGTAATRT